LEREGLGFVGKKGKGEEGEARGKVGVCTKAIFNPLNKLNTHPKL